MNKCPKCKANLRNGLSFCPKCGEIIERTKISTPNVDTNPLKADKYQKKNPILKILLWIFLFPIMLTITIIKSKKMNANTKLFLGAAFWICVIIISIANLNSKEIKYSNNTSTEIPSESTELDNQYIKNEEKKLEKKLEKESEKKSEKESDKKEIQYHENKTINKIITAYNEVAEVTITPDMVSNGAYSFNANIICNEVFVNIYKSDAGIFIDYTQEAKKDTQVFTLFRDFAKTLNPKITDKEIKKGFDKLRTGDWKNYTKYDMKGIECTYTTQKLINGQIRYTIKTECATY